MSGRFPGAPNLDAFWDNLSHAVESIHRLSDAELLAAGVDPELLSDPSYVKAAPLLEAPEHFDAAFFDISPGEAQLMDPQRRLLLECAWEALEDAGHDPARYTGAIGVYAGVGLNGYAIHNLFRNREVVRSVGELSLLLNGDKDYAATFVSYKLHLTGPSVNVQTACSTSLVAIHLARLSLLVGECDMALAGGASINVPHRAGYLYQEGNILSPDGHCRAFDAQARGTVFGSGCGVVVLKRLADALADGDRVCAVIKGSAVNNDGAAKIGYTAPSVEGQAAVVAQALASAGLRPEDIGYVEAHGTGTELGDPIEVAALTQAFRAGTAARGFCALGSLKPNVGHLNTAAGVASVIKTVLALEHGQIPPSLNYTAPNPKIDFDNSPFFVNSRLAEWRPGAAPRRAGVSSLGIGGTNAHIIFEEAPAHAMPRASDTPARQTLVLSARTPTALDAAADRLAEHLETRPSLPLADVAYTLQCGRRAFPHRMALRAGSVAEAAAALRQRDAALLMRSEAPERRPVVFMFPGQGAQFAGMGRELYAHLPRFGEALDQCLETLRPLLDLDLRELLFAPANKAEEAGRQLMQTRLTQPVLFSVEYALAQQLLAWGLEPAAMIGHSLGEYVAACLAGVFPVEAALGLVAARGQLMQAMPAGAMLSVALSPADLQPWLSEAESIAAVNAPQMCVVAGAAPAIEALQQRLEAAAVGCRRLQTSHAFHSAMMDEVLVPFAAQVQGAPRHVPVRRLISNVTGTWLADEAAVDPQYWARHVRAPVQFGPGLATVLDAEPDAVLVEVGPGQALSSLARMQRRGGPVVTMLGTGGAHGGNEIEHLSVGVARLWLAGAPLDWAAVWGERPRQRVALPTYPFERQRHWVDPVAEAAAPSISKKKPDLADWFYLPSWKRTARPRAVAPTRQTWLVLADGHLSEDLVERLRGEGETVVQAMAGGKFERLDEGTFVLEPKSPGDYQAMIASLIEMGRVPDRIVHLWSLAVEAPAGAGPTEASFREFQARGFYSLLYLTQGLGRHNVTKPIDLVVMSHALHDVTGEEMLRPEQGTLLGQCKVVRQEYHNLACRLVDVLPPERGSRQYARFLEAVKDELRAAEPETVVAYRNGHRWVQTYEPLRVEAAAGDLPMRSGGLVAFTGGLVGIGLSLAEYLAVQGGARLLFLEEANFPPEPRWAQWLEQNDPQHITSLKIRAALELRGRGVELVVTGTGLHNRPGVEEALALAEARFGPLRGVVHSPAGSSAGRIGTITDSGESECERNLAAVAMGLLVLDDLTRDRELDFRLALGSLGSVLGGVGYVSFGAASSFMSAFANWRNRAHRGPWQVQNWDSWKLEWQLDERIMTLLRDNLADRILPTAITMEEGLECFRRLFSLLDVGQVAISATDLQARIDQWVKLKSIRGPDAPKGLEARQPRPALTATYVAPRNATEQATVAVWEEMLGISPIGMYDNFYELGGNSLLATQVVSRLRQALGTDLSMAAMFEDPTVASVANVVIARQAVRDMLKHVPTPSD